MYYLRSVCRESKASISQTLTVPVIYRYLGRIVWSKNLLGITGALCDVKVTNCHLKITPHIISRWSMVIVWSFGTTTPVHSMCESARVHCTRVQCSTTITSTVQLIKLTPVIHILWGIQKMTFLEKWCWPYREGGFGRGHSVAFFFFSVSCVICSCRTFLVFFLYCSCICFIESHALLVVVVRVRVCSW